MMTSYCIGLGLGFGLCVMHSTYRRWDDYGTFECPCVSGTKGL